MGIPSVRKRPFWVTKTFTVFVVTVPPAGMAWVALAKALGDDKSPDWLPELLLMLAIWTTVGILIRVAQSLYHDREEAVEKSPADLKGCLWVMYRTIAQRYRPDGGELPSDALRITIHRVDGDHLEQCVPYIGGHPDEDGGVGRRFSKRSGIIGKVAMTGNPQWAKRKEADREKFLNEMASVWHVPREDAAKVKPDRFAWMAVPLSGENDATVAVIYLDSNDNSMFDDKDVRQLIITGCLGVAAFAKERYKA